MSGRKGPALLRLRAAARGPQLPGYADLQIGAEIKDEWARDPLPKLKAFAGQIGLGPDRSERSRRRSRAARAEAEARGVSSPER